MVRERLFLHVCCGPCACYPLEVLQAREVGLELWFYNPNIHPLAEFTRRRDTLAYLAMQKGLTVDFSVPYEPRKFLALAMESPQPPGRCRLCYRLRLSAAAAEAKARGHTAFSTTLLFSRRQKHDLIIEEGRAAAAEHGLEFHYEDWRGGWQRGFEIAKGLGLYRQNYCGCLFSELER